MSIWSLILFAVLIGFMTSIGWCLGKLVVDVTIDCVNWWTRDRDVGP